MPTGPTPGTSALPGLGPRRAIGVALMSGIGVQLLLADALVQVLRDVGIGVLSGLLGVALLFVIKPRLILSFEHEKQ